MSYVLIAMFVSGTLGSPPCIVMQRFETEEGCNKALTFIRTKQASMKLECIKDGNDKQSTQ